MFHGWALTWQLLTAIVHEKMCDRKIAYNEHSEETELNNTTQQQSTVCCVLLTCPWGCVGQSPQPVSTKRHKLPGGRPPDCYGTPDWAVNPTPCGVLCGWWADPPLWPTSTVVTGQKAKDYSASSHTLNATICHMIKKIYLKGKQFTP